MKRWTKPLLLILFLLPLLSGCSVEKNQASSLQKEEQKTVLCTIYMISDLVQSIAKDKVQVETLIRKELDPHSYELVKGDDEKLSSASLIFYNGLGLEHSPNIYEHLKGHPKSYALGNYIQNHSPESILYTDHQLDPHIWMDVSIWKKAVPLIVQELSNLIPEQADFFHQNGSELQKKMDNAHLYISNLMQKIPPERRYLITCHDAFYYFAKQYLSQDEERGTNSWRMRFIAPEGLAPDCQLSTTDIKRVIEFMRDHKVKTIFPEYNVNLDSIYKIKEASLKLGYPVSIAENALFGDTLSQNDSGKTHYLDMIIYNAETIYEHLVTEEGSI